MGGRVELPQRVLAVINGFKPHKHANAPHQNYALWRESNPRTFYSLAEDLSRLDSHSVLLPRLGSNQSYEVQSLACCLLHHRGLLHREMRSPLFKVGGQTLYR